MRGNAIYACGLAALAMLGMTSCSKGPDVPPSAECSPGQVCIGGGGNTYPPLSASISSAGPIASATVNYLGMAFNFYGQGGGGTDSYTGGAWSFGDGTTESGLGTVTHTYTTAGTYTVKFTVTDSAQYTASTTMTVTAAPGIETVLYNFTNELWANSLITGTDGNFYGTTPTTADGFGSVFKITPTGTLTTLYSLNVQNPADGCTPEGLTEGADGNFYGTTYTCGTYGVGNVFVVSPGGTETVLHAFGSSSTDGVNPKSSLIQNANGSFYGTTTAGGTYDFGTVFMLTTAGVETVLYSFGANSADGSYPGRLVLGPEGNLYGITTNGGAYGKGTVFTVTPTGVESVLYSFGASTTDGASPNSLLLGFVDGNFYGTTYSGGAYGDGSVFKITPAGVETILYSFGASTSDGQSPSDLLQASDGNLYGTTYFGGNFGGGTLFKLTPTGTMTMLYASFGSFTTGSSCAGGAFNPSNGASPIGITLSSDSVFYGFTTGGQCSGTIPLNGAIFDLAP
jgi:uncharacterized repeat protein (TIGR03803 family)